MDEARIEEIRQDVLARGFTRMMLLGPEELMAGPLLRRPIAASGVMVLVPGQADRAWIGAYSAQDPDDYGRLCALVAHGLEHGADSILVVGAELADAVGRMGLRVPVLAVEA